MELRWDPILGEWIVISGARGGRPLTAEGHCPFCPGSEEIPTTPWKVLMLPNRFPALSPNAPSPSIESGKFYRNRPSIGECEVILYTPNHEGSLANLEVDHIKAVVELWSERYRELSKKDYVKYVFIFENKGRETGTTLDHPHGQIYAFPFIPPIIRTELSSSRRYWNRHRTCLFCRILRAEQRNGSRMVYENDAFACFLPYFARWPYGVHIYPKRHVQALTDLKAKEQAGLAVTLKNILTRFDNLFQMSFPYMMVFHQKPSDGKPHNHYHFHVEFYPPYREKGKTKYFAGVETGAGTVTYDYSPEDKAKELRESPDYS